MAVERDLTNYDADVAARVNVTLNARLVFIDPSADEDKYHVLQVLLDPTGEKTRNCYLYQRWGNTGSRGLIKLDGPMDHMHVMVSFRNIVQEKTGEAWESLKPGLEPKEGKYWLQQQSTPDLEAKWQYYVNDGVNGKRTGWYPYDSGASDEVEELYAQHAADAGNNHMVTRLVSSGIFKYKVNLSEMTQENMRTHKIRPIRRAVGKDLMCNAGYTFSKPLKSMKRAMKMRRVMKEKRVAKTKKKISKKISKIGSRSDVLLGKKERTRTGIKQHDLMKNKEGKVVSKRKSALGKRNFVHVAKWISACVQARSELGLVGFVAVRKGSSLYNKARELYDARPHVAR